MGSHAADCFDGEVCVGRVKMLIQMFKLLILHTLSAASGTFLFNQFLVSLLNNFHCLSSHQKGFKHHLIMALLPNIFIKQVS